MAWPFRANDIPADLATWKRVCRAPRRLTEGMSGSSGGGCPMAILAMDRDAIRGFCEAHGIRELALFGSVLREDFGPDSDVDVLVEFAPGHGPSFFRLLALQQELSSLLGRPVDLVSKRGLSRHLKDRILDGREILYGRQG